ncbi:MAG: hypothetical protein EBR10_05960 [Planctomycetes bacterium]|nr:hypothetical protein [Planctomycetota bacterium]
MSPAIGPALGYPLLRACAAWLVCAAACAGDPLDDVVDQIRDMTSFQSEKGDVSLDFDFYATVDNWVISQPPPGIMVTGQNYLNSPRLSMLGTLQVQEWLSIFALGDVDRGFDPTDGSIQIRPDVYYAKISPFGGILQGKFGAIPTSYGQWVNRHFSWQNPLVNAPLAYEWFMGIRGDTARITPKTAPANRSTWLPIIWGPSYTSGGQFNGTLDRIDWAFEFKNDALSSAVPYWQLWENPLDGSALTYTGRLGWRPTTEWNIGASGSTGSYVVPNSFQGWQNYLQNNVGVDVSWAHGDLELWGEAHWSNFNVRSGPLSPAGTVGVVSYFMETRWRFDAQWWLAGRWNQQVYGDAPGSSESWDNDVWRIDACVGWRLDRTLTVKTQFSYTDESGPPPTGQPNKQGQYVFDLQLVFAF